MHVFANMDLACCDFFLNPALQTMKVIFWGIINYLCIKIDDNLLSYKYL